MNKRRLKSIYQGMKQRCYNPKRPNYKYYGGRGIVICDEWLYNSRAFYDWAMANGYKDNLTIERIDTNSSYCPDNCKWASFKEQALNKRTWSNTGVAGITYDKKNHRYRVYFRHQYLGSRKSLQEAIDLRNQTTSVTPQAPPA